MQVVWYKFITDILPLLGAYILALPIGWEREVKDRNAGLRTFPLVSVGSCGFILMALEFMGHQAEPQSRVLYGLMTGIGFIGGGAIVKNSGAVEGISTATSIWITGAIGAAVAYGSYTIAIALTVITLFTLLVLTPVKKELSSAEKNDDSDPPGAI